MFSKNKQVYLFFLLVAMLWFAVIKTINWVEDKHLHDMWENSWSNYFYVECIISPTQKAGAQIMENSLLKQKAIIYDLSGAAIPAQIGLNMSRDIVITTPMRGKDRISLTLDSNKKTCDFDTDQHDYTGIVNKDVRHSRTSEY